MMKEIRITLAVLIIFHLLQSLKAPDLNEYQLKDEAHVTGIPEIAKDAGRQLGLEEQVSVASVSRDFQAPAKVQNAREEANLQQIAALKTSRDWSIYRIGDTILYGGNFVDCHSPIWKPTVCCLYRSYTNKRMNTRKLIKALDYQRKLLSKSDHPIVIPDKNELVVHLRVGDGLCLEDRGRENKTNGRNCLLPLTHEPPTNCWKYPKDCYVNTYGYPYAFPESFYKGLKPIFLELRLKKNVSSVVVVSDAGHFERVSGENRTYEVDNAYRRNVATFFHDLGFQKVVMRNAEELSQTPDEDFQYLSSARYFVQGGGGFSRLVSWVVRKRGGQVFEPKNTTVLLL